MKKPMLIMLICVAILFGTVFIIKMIKSHIQAEYIKAHSVPIETVSAIKVENAPWNSELESVGSLRTVKGVNITTELAGMIQEIYFTPGTMVKKGDVLAKLDIAPDVAELHSLQAQATYAEITYKLNLKQYPIGAVSKETLDQSESDYKSTAASVAKQIATIDEKIIRAPFSGKIGISAVNIGQYLNPGDEVVTIETFDPIYDDFYLPQEQVNKLRVGQMVSVKVDAFPKQVFKAKISTINPIVDTDSRNIEVEVVLANPKLQLVPGMFNEVVINTGAPKNYLTLPQAAVTFNSYGSLVYVLEKTDQVKNNKPVWKATQSFVTTGALRGDQVQILKGVKAGELVVTSGQLKLKNGSLVVIDNSLQPANSPNPHPPEE